MKHTQGMMTVIFHDDGNLRGYQISNEYVPLNELDANRIRDCWNACETITDPSVFRELIRESKLALSFIDSLIGDLNGKVPSHLRGLNNLITHLNKLINQAEGKE